MGLITPNYRNPNKNSGIIPLNIYRTPNGMFDPFIKKNISAGPTNTMRLRAILANALQFVVLFQLF